MRYWSAGFGADLEPGFSITKQHASRRAFSRTSSYLVPEDLVAPSTLSTQHCDVMKTTTTAKHATEIENLAEFPKGIPKPHQSRNWALSFEAACSSRGLTCVLLYACPLV